MHKVQELPREGTNKLSKQRFSDLVETIRMIGHELSEISIVWAYDKLLMASFIIQTGEGRAKIFIATIYFLFLYTFAAWLNK